MGAGWGLCVGGFYLLVALCIYAFRGPQPFVANGTTLPATLAVYLVGGAVGGAIVGLLRPLARKRIGAAQVGVVAMLPVCLGAGFLVAGPLQHWGGGEVFGVTFTSVILGAFGGWEFWELCDQ